MAKPPTLNHFLGGSVAGFGAGVLGVKFFSGMWCVPFIGAKSPTTFADWAGVLGVKLWAGVCPLKFSLPFCAGEVACAGFAAATNGCDGVCPVLVMRSAGTDVGFDSGVFWGGFI
jgi:hypothetical protein